jgi:hypothetical protein
MIQLKLVLNDRFIHSIIAETVSPDRLDLVRVGPWFIVYVNAYQNELAFIQALIKKPDRIKVIEDNELTKTIDIRKAG